MADHHHRSTLKQQNKPFKGGSNSSKRAIKRINKGKVPTGVAGSGGCPKGGDNASAELARRSQRANTAKQHRDLKRQEMLRAKRGLAGSSPVAGPRIVAMLPITRAATVADVKSQVLANAKDPVTEGILEGPVTAEVAGGRVTLVEAGREMIGVLDSLAVADILLLVATAADDLDALSQHLIITARNFALPSAIGLVVQGVEVRWRLGSNPQRVICAQSLRNRSLCIL
jgi:pre-rRNA-processing protein TSR1